MPATAGEHRHHLLLAALLGHLRAAGATIRYAALDGDARWHAATQTLTLRADATPEDHIAVLGDLIRITLLKEPTARGATTRRHLRLITA